MFCAIKFDVTKKFKNFWFFWAGRSISWQNKLPRLESLDEKFSSAGAPNTATPTQLQKAGIKSLDFLESGGRMEDGMMIDEAHSTVLTARATASSLLFFAACVHRCMDMDQHCRQQACSCGTAGANKNQFHITRRRHPTMSQARIRPAFWRFAAKFRMRALGSVRTPSAARTGKSVSASPERNSVSRDYQEFRIA